ncbi:MAG TPA: hypothetical protein ACHBZA_02190 [Arsenophonus apicola]|uniref:hypothetical protein n=1 Tax=Arsenophonus TaxID=637 RepID=UPI0015D77BF0|nr:MULTISPECIES: hypothetical protein [Arsenophonus]UBX28929.1 hypothetical protein LDL57_14325 [Arsenophonus apicola]
MGVTLERIKNFFHIQQIETDKAKLVLVTDFDKLSQAMNNWGSPFHKGEIEKQLQILSNSTTNNIPKTTYNKILAFSQLAKLAGEKHRYDFQIDIAGEYNNQIKLSVKDIFSQNFTIFDDPMVELHNALKIPLMNGSQFLKTNSDIEQKQLINFIKDNVKLTINNEEKTEFNIAGVTKSNQKRLGVADFSSLILVNLAENQELLQTYIKAKMKCFDYFSGISIYYAPIIAELANDSKTENLAIAIKKQFNDMRDKVEAVLSKQLVINPGAFVDYCNNIINKDT